MSKRLVGISMVKNEGDIVETFVRHNLRFLDHLIVQDDSSTDATPHILRALVEEGMHLSLVSVPPDPMFRQGKRTTALAYDAFGKHGADFVFPIDADEFIRAPSRQVLDDALGHTDSEVMNLRWPTFVPKADSEDRHPLLSLRWRVETDKSPLPKIVLSRRVMDSPNWRIGRGNHVLFRQVAKDLNWNTGNALQGVELCHLPFRSPEQLTGKALVGWLARKLAYGPTSTSNSWHFRELFQRVQAGDPITMTDVRNYAIGIYALGCMPSDEALATVQLIEDPVAEPMPLRYTPAEAVDPMQLLAAWASLLVDDIIQSAAQRAAAEVAPVRAP